MGHGMAGIQGPVYDGTGYFQRRKVLYGLTLEDRQNEGTNLALVDVIFINLELLITLNSQFVQI